jgi:hypothetical protein
VSAREKALNLAPPQHNRSSGLVGSSRAAGVFERLAESPEGLLPEDSATSRLQRVLVRPRIRYPAGSSGQLEFSSFVAASFSTTG